jgi:SAM-dependent methyltransferase
MTVVGIALALVVAGLVSIVWPSLVGAPWVPTSRETVREMLTMAHVRPGDVVYDLGCGDGRVLIAAARAFGARAVGIEIDPLRYVWTQVAITALGLRGQVVVKYGSFFAQDLRSASVVTCYLLQRTNDRLMQKLERELVPGTRVVSNTFIFADWSPVRYDAKTNLYLYTIDGERPSDTRSTQRTTRAQSG